MVEIPRKMSVWRPPEHIVGYRRLAEQEGYSWAHDLAKLGQLRHDLRRLRDEEKRILAKPLAMEDYIERVRIGYDFCQARRYAKLADLLAEFRGHDKPLEHFQKRIQNDPELQSMPPWPEIEEALGKLPVPADGISGKAREKTLAKIRGRQTSLSSRIEALQSETLKDANHFVGDWKFTQRQIAGPVGPYGIDLKKSPDAEQKAWNVLGLAAIVPREPNFFPHPGS